LFEQEIPELSEEVISIDAISREPGYRSKVAVSSIDSQVDPIAVCVGFRGSRIKAVREELAGEHIDVVRYSEDPQVLIPNALQPATVEQVLLCDLIGRAIVLVQEDQLSLAIGRRGQNVRLASKLCGWDIEIMTSPELEEKMDIAIAGFSSIPLVTEEVAQGLVEQGYLSYDDLSVIEPEVLMEMSGLTAEQVDDIVQQAEIRAEDAEEAAAEERRVRRERERDGKDHPASGRGGSAQRQAEQEAEAVAESEAEHGVLDEVDVDSDDSGVDDPHAEGMLLDLGAGETAQSGNELDGQQPMADADPSASQPAGEEMVEDGAEATGSSPKSP
jgi:N utilization substance protein A